MVTPLLQGVCPKTFVVAKIDAVSASAITSIFFFISIFSLLL
jgi:hypothetical protein